MIASELAPTAECETGHPAAKASREAFLAATVDHAVWNLDGDPLQIGTCPACRSTIAIPAAMCWNPRYLAYCRAQGEPDPDRMLERDRERYPGGRMAGFIVWVSQRWQEWRAANGRGPDAILSGEDHEVFDAWLREVARG